MNEKLYHHIVKARINRSAEPVYVPSDDELTGLFDAWTHADLLRESSFARDLVDALLVRLYG